MSAPVIELHTPAEVADASPDLLVRWAAQALTPAMGGRAWRCGRAVAVAAPALSRHDRLVLAAPTDAADDAATLLAAHRRGLRPLMRTALARAVGAPEAVTFGWMELRRSGQTAAAPRQTDPPTTDGAEVGRLDRDRWPAVTDLLAAANPDAYAWPGRPAAARWAGVRDADGLVAVGADVWSTPGVGFMGGVATAPHRRGQGLARRVCTFLTAALLAEHDAVTLMVDRANAPAIAVYRRLGYRYDDVSALPAL